MDSMKSLNTSLPRPPRKARTNHPPEQLIQAFKNAALSVTNLYRTAEADESRSRQAGYQEALDDLLSYLDKENIGLDDGEGWRIRQWATEHLDNHPGAQGSSESDEERIETVRPARTTSATNPPRLPDQNSRKTTAPSESSSPVREELPTAVSQHSASPSNPSAQPSGVFTFRPAHSHTQDADMYSPEIATIDLSHPEPPVQAHTSSAITVNVLPRASRVSRGSRQSQRSSTLRNLGVGAGSKRRIPLSEYFDLGSLEGPGGGSKRGRMT